MSWDQIAEPLNGERVRLEPLTAEHGDALFAASDFEEIWTWMPIERPSAEVFPRVVDHLLNENAAGRQATWVTIDKATDQVIGTSSFLALRPEHRGLEIGWTWLTPAQWGGGANIEAKRLMMDHAFGPLDCLRVEFKTDANNAVSRRALEALPATFEGIFRRHMLTNYGVRDSAYYSVIAEDWPAVRESLNARLAARR